jgi:ABC-type hemin transport system substrate-binding protein
MVGAAQAAGLPRIASMNVCTDQLLLTLADPEQILGLSRFSREKFQSWAADDARRYRILSGGAEDILVLRPDIVVASLFDKRSTRELLKQKGRHLAEFSVPRSLDEAKEQIRQMGDIGHPDRATAEIARLDDAIARGRYRQALSGAAAVPARLGVRQRQPGQFTSDRDRVIQCGWRSRRRLRRLRIVRGDREPET